MRRRFLTFIRPRRVRNADPVPLWEALADALEELAVITEQLPPGWQDSPHAMEVRVVLNRGLEALADAAGMPSGDVRDGIPLVH